MCPPGFGSAIFRRQIVQRRISSGQWARLSQEFAINSLAPLRTFWPQSCWVSVPQNCFIPLCGSRRGWPGSFCLSFRVPVYSMCSRIICRGWHAAFNIQGPGGWIGYAFADQHRGLLRNAVGPARYASPADRNLCDHADPGHRTASNSSCSRDGCRSCGA